MATLHRICGFISTTVRQVLAKSVDVLRSHQRRMADNDAYRADVLSALEGVVKAYAGRFTPAGITVVRLYGTL